MSPHNERLAATAGRQSVPGTPQEDARAASFFHNEARPAEAAHAPVNGQRRRCYADAAPALLASGLGSPLPLPPGQKSSPPSGWTGADAPYASASEVARWVARCPGANIALRLAPDVVGFDVDSYDGRPGAETMARWEAEHGPLPPTWVSSARPAPSGIRWYRLPEGATSAGMGDLGPGVELLRSGHRYACVPPSLHPLGVPVAWRRPDGTESPKPPSHAEVPVLTGRQVEGLAAHRTSSPRRTTPSPATASQEPAASPEVPEALVGRVRAYAREAYAGLVADARALAALPEGERMPLAGEVVGWESGLGKHLVLRACQLDAASWHGGAPGTFVAAVRGASRDPDWTRLVDEKVRAKARIAEPAPLPRFVTDYDPSDPFTAGYVAQPTAVATTSEHGELEELETLEKAVSGEGSGALSDAKLSKRFAADVLKGRAVYLGRRHGWRRWNSRCWEPVEESAIVGLAREYFIRWHASAAARGCTLAILKALSSRLSAAKLEAVVRLSKADVAADVADFDAYPDLLNVANGVVDLTTGALLPHDPALLLTKVAPTRYVPGATHPDWTAALAALPDGCLEWFQHRCGQGITGHAATDDGACITVGGGSDGKTVIYGSILAAIGQHGCQLSDRILTGRPGDHPTELAEADGVRFALVEELPTGPLNVKRVKDLVGTPTIKARRMYEDSRGFSSTLTLFITTNHLPQVAETDHGTWRRLLHLAMPYRYVLPPTGLTRRDRRADEDLKARMLRGDSGQHEAVLAWLVAGARPFYAAGHRMTPAPASIIAASAAWRRSEDRVYGFLDADCVLAADRYVHADELWQAYRDYATAQGRHPGSAQEFVKRLEEHELIVKSGVTKRKKLAADQQLSTRRLGPPAGSFNAWFGIAFKTDPQASDLQDSAYSGLRKPFLETSYAGEVSQAPESPESESFLRAPDPPPGPLCSSCGVPLSWQREAAGLARCVACSAPGAKPSEPAEAVTAGGSA